MVYRCLAMIDIKNDVPIHVSSKMRPVAILRSTVGTLKLSACPFCFIFRHNPTYIDCFHSFAIVSSVINLDKITPTFMALHQQTLLIIFTRRLMLTF